MKPILFDRTRRLLFNRNSRESFIQQLQLDNRQKHVLTVDKAQDLFLLGREARLQNAYRLTPVGASQLFAELSPGLYQMLRFVEEQEAERNGVKAIVSYAAQVVNRLAKLRESQLVDCKLICCGARMQLDGFAGRRYTLVSNQNIFELFLDACEAMRNRPQFHVAEILGREMTAMLLAPKPAKGTVHLGIVIQNGETPGRAIRVASVVMDTATKSWSMGEFSRETRIPHVKSKIIRDRMNQMIDYLSTQQLILAAGLGRYFEAKQKRIARRLTPAVVAGLRKKLTASAEGYGVSMADLDAVMVAFTDTVKEDRAPTVHQLYLAVCQVAGTKPIGRSIALRQLAYSVIF